jgi:hypothetical protein
MFQYDDHIKISTYYLYAQQYSILLRNQSENFDLRWEIEEEENWMKGNHTSLTISKLLIHMPKVNTIVDFGTNFWNKKRVAEAI